MTPTGGSRTSPTLRTERELLRAGHRTVAGMDEVGRGALAGPVTVGVVVVDGDTRSAPAGVRDSKELSAARREELVPALQGWGVARGVGHASPAEIDAHGIMGGLRLAGRRALDACGVEVDVVLLDGKHDWLTDPMTAGLLAGDGPPVPPVVTRIGGDRTCSSVAAASVLAKVERDARMVALARDPEFAPYGWEGNKGYAAAGHREALRRWGVSREHRRSWRLGIEEAV
ncbi:RNase HII [Kytococcus aerolatus]|uniref:Ribonuclease n=1 Tax=Kytococcus aerolatus TaxID=592308 RepID=A0A212U1T9_9MICO|nr:ribonuclease HII [Kytococcus aerolatus]SNC72208.1 RNase HII [Kytococcus aerolatus]